MARLTATEVARDFSRVINRVRGGEEIEVVRNGEPVASLRPLGPPTTVSAAQWRALVAGLPPVDDDFAIDVDAARAALSSERGAWPS